MSIINILTKDTVDKIAAGEVIEGPNAVVKELVENAIDAKANSVTVEIKDGGISLIRVTDNGSGISEDDIKKAFMPHATSKISDAVDLVSVKSLGFRGEALSSIAAVAKVETLTKTVDSPSGIRYVIEGGEEVVNEPVGCPEGTTFIIRDLFYNTPARKKFLKTPTTEARYIEEVMEHMALSHPLVAMKFIVNGQTKLQTPGNGKLKDVIFYLYGKETAGSLLPVGNPDFKDENDANENGISVRGFAGKPSFTRGNREYENYFVNGRFVKDKVITRAVEDAYKSFLMQHRYPFTCVLIDMDPETVDVNVHPRKLEVRFTDREAVYQAVFRAIDTALRTSEIIPEAENVVTADKKSMVRERMETVSLDNTYKIPDIPMPEPFEAKRKEEWKKEIKPLFTENVAETGEYQRNVEPPVTMPSVPENPVPELHTPEPSIPEASVPEPPASAPIPQKPVQNSFAEGIFAETAISEIRLIGQVYDTYWIMEYGGDIYIADQHACHEKVMYEKILREVNEKRVASEQLLTPIVVTLSPVEMENYGKIADDLAKLGFEIDEYGGNDLAIKAVPSAMYGLSEKELFFDILDQYGEEGKVTTADTVLSKVATMACKAAVKGNMRMTEVEMKALLTEMMKLENPYNCPHGRPTMIKVTKSDLEKKFKRQLS